MSGVQIAEPDRAQFSEFATYLVDRSESSASMISGRLSRISEEATANVGGSRIHLPAGTTARGDIHGNSARPAEIQRNLHLIGAIERGSPPRGSVADCVDSPGNPEKHQRAPAIRPVLR